MSGGHFDYRQFHIQEFAEQLERELIAWRDKTDICQFSGEPIDRFGFEDPQVLNTILTGLAVLKVGGVFAQRIDWLLSGDDGPESFLKRLAEDLAELKPIEWPEKTSPEEAVAQNDKVAQNDNGAVAAGETP